MHDHLAVALHAPVARFVERQVVSGVVVAGIKIPGDEKRRNQGPVVYPLKCHTMESRLHDGLVNVDLKGDNHSATVVLVFWTLLPLVQRH